MGLTSPVLTQCKGLTGGVCASPTFFLLQKTCIISKKQPWRSRENGHPRHSWLDVAEVGAATSILTPQGTRADGWGIPKSFQ